MESRSTPPTDASAPSRRSSTRSRNSVHGELRREARSSGSVWRRRLERLRRALRARIRARAGARRAHARGGSASDTLELSHRRRPLRCRDGARGHHRDARSRRLLQAARRGVPPVRPEYGPGWQAKIVLPSLLGATGSASSRSSRKAPAASSAEARLSSTAYREVVAATNFKQRTRKMLEYYHADRSTTRWSARRTDSSTTRASS